MQFKERIQRKIFHQYLSAPTQLSKFLGLNKDFSKPKVFCIGLPRSGTHSLANIFKSNFKSAHEPFEAQNLYRIIEFRKGLMDDDKVINFLKLRNDWLRLEVEAAHYLYILTPYIHQLFPDAKFILTVREPLSWLKSEMRMNIKMHSGIWENYQDIKYGSFSDKDSLFKKNDYIYPLNSYLRYYNHHIKFIIENLPKENLLVLDTFEIVNSLENLATFVGLPSNSLLNAYIHSGKYKKNNKDGNFNEIITDKEIINGIKIECLGTIDKYVPFLRNRMNYL